MFLKDLIQTGIKTISHLYPEIEAREMVLAYLCDTLDVKRHTHIVEPQFEVEDELAGVVMAAFERLAEGEPLQYVTGKAYFYGREFRVTPDTLIPRPETELLCRMAVEASVKQNPRILDLCTGSGCIAWTLALELPRAEVTAVDVSDAALAVASSQDFTEEISRTGASSPIFIKQDILVMTSEVETSPTPKYDMILSNPPYVMDSEKALMRKNVLDYEPHLALFVSDSDPLVFYRAVADRASGLLSQDGFGVVEINEALGEETADIFRSRGFTATQVVKDFYDKDRFVRFAWK